MRLLFLFYYDLPQDLRSEKHTFGVNWGETEEVGIFHDQYGMSASQIESALNAMAYGTALENNPHSAKIEAYIYVLTAFIVGSDY